MRTTTQVKIEQLEQGIRVRMSSDLLFHEGGVEISPNGRAALDKIAPTLSSRTYQVDVIGNTDNLPIGPELVGRSVDPSRMQAISAGQYHPVASNDTPQGRALNRRTDILLRPTS